MMKAKRSFIEDKTWRSSPAKVRFIRHFAALPWHLSCRVYRISEHRVRCATFHNFAEPSALSDNSFLRSHFFLRPRSVFSPFFRNSILSSPPLSYPTPSHPSTSTPSPFLFLYRRFSISRSVVVTFKRNLHNGTVRKSVFS